MDRHAVRVAGVTVPLFSLRTASSWGIGSIADLAPFASWIREAGLSLIQLLPIAEGSGASASPYAALSAFGIDPIYIELDPVEGLGLTSGEATDVLDGEQRRLLAKLRAADTIDYQAVGTLKRKVLQAAFEVFHERESKVQGALGREFIRFMSEQSGWLDNFALFRALKTAHQGAPWWEWPVGLRDRDRDTLRRAQAALSREIIEIKYLQWVADRQWSHVRAELRSTGVELMGDLPFMVDRDSADVWSRRELFRMDMSVGVPADQFDEDGQDWGMPPYDWTAMERDSFAWLRQRCAYAGRLYDRFRIDHLVGFYRTYMRPLERRRDEIGKLVPGSFSPAGEAEQEAHGERVLRAMLDGCASAGARLIAEDLGSIPDFVRPSLERLGVPGYKVLIWEKEADERRFVDPKTYPRLSVACFGTHDTEPVAAWWEGLDPEERAAVAELLGLREAQAPFSAGIHGALCSRILGAGSELVLLLVQDLLGSRERINTPGTVGAHNWTYRLPAPIEVMREDPAIAAMLARVAAFVRDGGRS